MHAYLHFPCAEMALPPHPSPVYTTLIYRCFRVPCGQMRLPPHALHVYLILRCKQMAPMNVASPDFGPTPGLI